MSDAPYAHNTSSTSGGPDRSALRVSRMAGLEHLLGNIARHLHATGDRHSDVIVQLQDRLRFLSHAASAAAPAPDIDRHLALFEAQLTSLAIRTGVQPQSLPQTAVQAPMQPAPHQQIPVHPQHQAAQAPQAALSPVANPQAEQAVSPSAPAWGPLPQPKPTPEELAAAKAQAVGAPPPVTPAINNPALNALTRQSDLTFEDALAADRALQAQAAGDAVGIREEDHIFAYQPPVSNPSTPLKPSPPEANPQQQTAPAEELVPVMPVEFGSQEIVTDAIPSGDSEATADTDNTPRGFDAAAPTYEADPQYEATSFAPAAISEAPAHSADTDPAIGTLRSDLEAALSDAPASDTAFDPVPVADTPAQDTQLNESAASAEQGVDVLGEIARLNQRIDSVTTSVDRIESNFEQSRNEMPSLIEQAALAAAKQTAEQVGGNDSGLNRRIDELHDLLDNRHVAAAPTPRAPVAARTAASYEQELAAEVTAVAAEPVTETRLAQAKQSMLKKLAPVGSAISRRGRKVEDSSNAEAQNDEAAAPAIDAPAERVAQQAAPALNHIPEPQVNLSEQSISSLRKSLFQTMKDGAPPALVIVFSAIALLSGSLLLTLKSGDGEKDQQTIAQVQVAANTGTSADLAPVDVTHSTSKMSDTTATKVRTVGALQPTMANNSDASRLAQPVKPTALKPLSNSPPGGTTSNTGSKLELPPLTTGPLSLRVAAAGGDPAAQFEVASRLAQGNGVTRDPIAAVKWYTRAASAGHARAQYRLAALYERGAGVATDTGRAKVWYTRAAQQGNVKAMHNLAVLHAGQAAGAANYVNAAQWFERAAEHGLADSQFNVAILYLNGLGVTKNLNDAYKWFALAAQQGDQEAVRRLKGVKAQLTPSQRRTADQTIKTWRARPALEAANKAVVWQPKSVSKTPAPVAATRALVSGPKVAANTGPLGPTDVKKVQRLLNGLGFDVGTPDGKVGGKTKTSIKSFQSQNGMIPTGRVDRTLIGRIESIMRERAAKLGKI